MQLRTLTRMNRDKIVAEHEELQRKIADYIDILAKPERQRKIIGDELDEIVAKYGDDRRTKILPFSGEMNVEDLIAEENVVVTVTHPASLSAPRPTNTAPSTAAARASRAPSCARTTWWITSS